MKKVYGIILSGGMGIRMDRNTPKQFIELGGKPLITWSVEAFHACKEIDHIIIVYNEKYRIQLDDILSQSKYDKLLKLVGGGLSRQGSVNNALLSHDFNDDDILVIHDAARPFVKQDIIIRCINEAIDSNAAGAYIPATDTIAQTENMYVQSIPDRKNLYLTQTPQAFSYKVIMDSHEKAKQKGKVDATDDVSLAIDAGYKVRIVEGDYSNIKITNQHDLDFAKVYINRL
ncbi:2-C-methyl-D-erythritol 4-phosphate cytidylyltransferase [Spirochaetota bacterium]